MFADFRKAVPGMLNLNVGPQYIDNRGPWPLFLLLFFTMLLFFTIKILVMIYFTDLQECLCIVLCICPTRLVFTIKNLDCVPVHISISSRVVILTFGTNEPQTIIHEDNYIVFVIYCKDNLIIVCLSFMTKQD